MQNAMPTVALLAVAGGVFWFARGLDTAAQPATSGPAAVPVAPAAVAAAAPAPAAEVAPAPVAPAPVAPAPVAAPSPAPSTPPAQPVAVAPVPAVEAAPAPVAAPTPSAPPPATVAGKNPDDSPARTQSGKVFASKDPNSPPAFGPVDALVDVLIVSDYQCPVCRRAVDATHQIAEEFPGEVRVVFWNNALEMHRNAKAAALAGLAAHRQGKFWEMHDKLFENQAALDAISLETYAQTLGLDMEAWKKDIADPALDARVNSEGAMATALEARGTPAFVVNGKVQVGWGSWNGFKGMVERELTDARALKAQGKTPAQIREQRARENSANEAAFTAYKSGYLQAALALKN